MLLSNSILPPQHGHLYSSCLLYTSAPNGTKVYAEGEALHNQIRTVRLERLYREGLLGTLCGD